MRTCHEVKQALRTTFGFVLSVVIIAKNESHNLPRCLQSVQTVADEVIVVDSDSTDGTPELRRITRRTRVPKALHDVCRPEELGRESSDTTLHFELGCGRGLG